MQQRRRMGLEALAGGGEGHAGFAPHEQRLAEAQFEFLDARADGRLRHMQGVGRADEAAGLDDLQERADLIHIHGRHLPQ